MTPLDGTRRPIAVPAHGVQPGSRISFIDGAVWLMVVVPVGVLMFMGGNDLRTSSLYAAILVVACLLMMFRSTSNHPSNLLLTAFVVVYTIFHFGIVAVYFINAENITDTRQTRFDPLLVRERTADGRITLDAWAPLDGRTFNVGVRAVF